MIIWLASYPKSGNTLLRSLLSGYFFSQDGDFNFEILRMIDQFPNIRLFEKLGIDLSNKLEVQKNYIEAQKLINLKKNSIQFWKTHSAFCKFENKYAFTDLENTAGVIYVVRDPRNVVLSYSNHYQKSIQSSVNDLNDHSEIRQSINDKLPVLLGSWKFNYNSWKQLDLVKRYLLIKYEDLINNPEKTMVTILNFINRIIKSKNEIDESKMRKVIENTSFEKIKKLENEFGFKEAMIKKNGEKINFFNLGPNNRWEKFLDKSSQKKIESFFGKEMKELGYL